MSNSINLIGEQFGDLKVIKRDGNYNNGETAWVCKCKCGNVKKFRGYNLRNGLAVSCGACGLIWNEEEKRFKNYTDDHSESYVIGYTQKGEPFWFDKEDLSLISQYCWHYNNVGYVSSNKDNVLLHRLVMGLPNPKLYDVDHKKHPPRNEHKVDNRKQNLEIKTRSQNLMNQCVKLNNMSGITGVSYDKKNNKWVANITVMYKKIFLGRFANKEDAVKARKEAEIKYFGEYRYDENN